MTSSWLSICGNLLFSASVLIWSGMSVDLEHFLDSIAQCLLDLLQFVGHNVFTVACDEQHPVILAVIWWSWGKWVSGILEFFHPLVEVVLTIRVSVFVHTPIELIATADGSIG